VNLGYTFEEADLPITILRSFTFQEDAINFWKDWGSPTSFIVGVITGKLDSALWEILKNCFKRNNSKVKKE